MARTKPARHFPWKPVVYAVLALALGRTDGERISLTDIRGLGVATTLHAKRIADFLVQQQLLQAVSDTLFEVPEVLRQRFTEKPVADEGGATPQETPQVTPQVSTLLAKVTGEMTRQELMDSVGLKDRMHFAKAYLQPALDAGVLEMTIPDKPRSGNQRYRLTPLGQAVIGQGDT